MHVVVVGGGGGGGGGGAVIFYCRPNTMTGRVADLLYSSDPPPAIFHLNFQTSSGPSHHHHGITLITARQPHEWQELRRFHVRGETSLGGDVGIEFPISASC